MSEPVAIEEIPTLDVQELWLLLQVYVNRIGTPLGKDSVLPSRGKLIFKTLEQKLGLVSPPFPQGSGQLIY